jgi:Ca2+-binding EF-hand superfamily protein
VAREFRIEGDRLNPAVAIFFGAYVFVVCLVLLNVVVAVLLDQFINTMSMEKEQESEEKDKEKRIENGIQDLTGSLDPLMVSLSKFSSDDELQELIDSLFEVIDADQNGELDFEEARLGFDRLVSKNALDVEEWGRLTQGLSSSQKNRNYLI